MGHHYLAEVSVYRNDDEKPTTQNRYHDTIPAKPATSRELVKTYLRAQTLSELRGKVEAILITATDVHETADDK